MNRSAQLARDAFLAVVLITVAALALTKSAWAASGNVQICQPSTGCTVGEFLYNDSYVPITTATCVITSRYPNGSLFLNAVNMPVSAEGDGWYAYTLTAPSTLGLYRTEVKCTVGTEVLALDKSFEVQTAPSTLTSSDVASAVWGYSNRSLSTFGSLVSDVWNYSTRSLPGFGTLAADVWKNATRTLTGASLDSGSVASKSDVDSIKKTTQDTRLLIEQIVNKPIIQHFIEEVPDLGAKIDNTKTVANQLFINVQYASSKTGLMALKWNRLSDREVEGAVNELLDRLGSENDSSSTDSLFGQINYLKSAWGWTITDEIFAQAKIVKKSLTFVQNELSSTGASKRVSNEMKQLTASVGKLESEVGDISNSSNQNTIFGKVKEVRELVEGLDSRTKEADSLLARWDSYQSSDRKGKIQKLARKTATLNKIPKVNLTILSSYISSNTSDKDLKNKVYSVRGVIDANRQLLARSAGLALSSTWLEAGSIIFKSLITNPSDLISQTVSLKYYLPVEVKEENVIKIDDGLKIAYDSEKGQYYVSGEFILVAEETKTLSITVDDSIFQISNEEIESLQHQAEELSRPLENTSYFSQGVTLKSDIDVSLNKIITLQKNGITPEAKIRAYREAKIELDAVKVKMDKLKDLVTQAGSVGTLFGFVGGAQTLAVWGLIIILLAGFVFLALYMKMLRRSEMEMVGAEKVNKSDKPKKNNKVGQQKQNRVGVRFVVVMLLLGMSIGMGLGVGVGRMTLPNQPAEKIESSAVTSTSNESPPNNTPEEISPPEKLITIVVPKGSSVNVREEPSLSSTVLTRLKDTTDVLEIEEDDEWVKIRLKDGNEFDKEGWINKKFVKKEISEVTEESDKSITINNTPTGFLRVRQGPWGQEITKVYPGDTFLLIEEEGEWLQIELEDGVFGWIYSEYAIKS